MPVTINNILVFGDSLSDRGTMEKSALAAFSGLWGTSPHGRFTNGFVWLDYFIQRLKTNEHCTLIPPSATQRSWRSAFYSDESVGTKTAPTFARTYCEGGMTAYDYSKKRRPGEFFLNITAQFLATLKELRERAFDDDKYMALNDTEKETTLVIEWSGANDLITINDEPTVEAAEKAVEERIANIEAMIKKGYCHFAIFNLPDLSLTPRYQNGDANLREQAHEAVQAFNLSLQSKIDALSTTHSECTFNLFDANALFIEAYETPEAFGLDKKKRHNPFLDSRAFKDNDPTTTAAGYMFWDDVHPTEAVHVHLANTFYEQIFQLNYHFEFAKQTFVRQFEKAYGMAWEKASHGWCGSCSHVELDYLASDLTLENILHCAIYDNAPRVRTIVQKLGWIDKTGACTGDNPALTEAWQAMQSHHEEGNKQREESTFEMVIDGV